MYERIKMLCKQNGTNITALERELGFAKGSICKWENHEPSYERVKMIADRFHVSVEYIKNGEDVKWNPKEQTMDYTISLSEEEQDLLMEYRKADDTQKEMIRRILAYSDKM
jgi:transcriptional regulator with XRE-family HTH domain|nr:MAG TPA_asm: repressor protein [Caudoviricetes sp.]